MIKRLMSITLVVALVLAQSTIAGAFVSDGTAGPFTASVDLSGGTPVATLSVVIKKVADNTADTAIGFAGVTLGANWKKASQYLQVTYNANQIGWGVQIYTDNLAATANPKYGGDPTTDPSRQPAGLIGVQNTLLTCPMAILVTDAVIPSPNTNLQIPVEAGSGDAIYFTSGYDEDTGTAGVEKVWFWLKDKQGTIWNDANNNGTIEAGEIKPSFNYPNGYPGADDYATIVSTLGSSSGWVDATSGRMQRDNSSASPIMVYVAAKFRNARELQEYKTNTLTLEIYHQ